MCGILGKVDMRHGISGEELQRMLDVIRHRGPDDEGYFVYGKKSACLYKGKDTVKEFQDKEDISALESRDAYLCMAHRRLSIIDISSAGHQPMRDAKAHLVITYNGEIYNYIELRQELENTGYSFCTNTDTEVILKAYQEWGKQCVEHFNGMWAFAIFDEEQGEIFCSRDRLGAKPFYYYIAEDKFIFASEMKQICQDRQIERKMNEKVLAAEVIFRISDYNEETLLENIYSLPGGYNLSVSLDFKKEEILCLKKEQYWDLKIGKEKDRSDRWYEYIKKAIRLRLRGDAPVGAMLSGGVDSSFIVGEISKYYKENGWDIKDFPTFTSCYENAEEHDETYFAHLVNETCGTAENLIYPDKENTFDAYRKMIWHFEEFSALSTLGSFMTLEEISKSGIKVLINGQGGDESMFGYERYYSRYFMDLLKKGRIIRFIHEYGETVRNSKFNMKQLLQNIVYFGIPAVRRLRNQIKARKYVTKDLRCCLDEKEIKKCISNKSFDDLIYNELRKGQLAHNLLYDDRAYMAFSMEGRVPFIDYEYLESVVDIEPRSKFRKGYTKFLIREKMVGSVPEKVIWRTNKNGWSSPAERWIARFPEEELEKLFQNPHSSKYFDVKRVKKLYETNHTCREFENFLSVEVFMRLFEVSA